MKINVICEDSYSFIKLDVEQRDVYFSFDLSEIIEYYPRFAGTNLFSRYSF